MAEPLPVVIVGAGAAGLTAARVLHAAGVACEVHEAAPRVGGRLATDTADGFRFDRGFQILLTAYPAVQRYIDLAALDYRAFRPGAHLMLPDGTRSTVGDPIRDPAALWSTLTSPVASLRDKLLLARLLVYVRTHTCAALFETPEVSTASFLHGWGFSARFRENFFEPFYAGIFLERALATSCRMFLFTFKMFAEGEAVLPAGGIQSVAETLAAPLPAGCIHFGSSISSLSAKHVTTAGGNTVAARAVIDARDGGEDHEGTWLDTVNVYFAVPSTQLPDRYISLLPATGAGTVNNVAILSGVQPAYGRRGERLVSVSLFESPGQSLDYYVMQVRESLWAHLGLELDAWRPLRHYEVRRALPFAREARWTVPAATLRDARTGVWRAGDYLLGPSLQQAMHAGELAAEGVVASFAEA